MGMIPTRECELNEYGASGGPSCDIRSKKVDFKFTTVSLNVFLKQAILAQKRSLFYKNYSNIQFLYENYLTMSNL